MGTVYRAEQAAPVRRVVAVKVIRAGLGGRAVIARFEAERQALARMDHPHIARVLDAGGTPDGRPYFAMELVDGVPVTQFCDAAELSVRDRLGLFVQVCQAVQHAHQKGVIHRDLKPSNVLVAAVDGKPLAKVIDFGVAKATGEAAGDRSADTGLGTLVGTLAYMSPEQAAFDRPDVDTRADVYALGAILYELLAGTPPFPADPSAVSPLHQLKTLREVDPDRPSVRAAPAVARHLRGDLDWITLKCLEKDRRRRYDSAAALADDVDRHLRGEPVAAAPPGRAYRVRKFVRRNRGPVLAAAAVAVALVCGVVGTTLGLIEARRQRDGAVQARQDEAAQRRQAEAVAGLMESAFAGIDPSAPPDDLRRYLVTRLSAVGTRLDDERDGDPPAQARLRLALGKTLVALGDAGQGRPHLEQALDVRTRHLGPDHPDTLACAHALGQCYTNSYQREAAIAVLRRTLAGRQARLGPAHDDTVCTMLLLADTLANAGDDDSASDLFRRAWEAARGARGDDHVLTQEAKLGAGACLLHGDDAARGLRLMTEVVDWHRANTGPDHPVTLAAARPLAIALLIYQQYEAALPLNELMARGHESRDGPNHFRTLAGLEKLRQNYAALGRSADAERVLADLLVRCRRIEGADPRLIAMTLYHLADGLLARRRPADAEPLLRDARAALDRAEPDGWETYHVRSLLGASLAGQGRYAEAEPLVRSGSDGLTARQATIPPPVRYRMFDARDRVAALYKAWGKTDEVRAWDGRVAGGPRELAPVPRAAAVRNP